MAQGYTPERVWVERSGYHRRNVESKTTELGMAVLGEVAWMCAGWGRFSSKGPVKAWQPMLR